MVPAPTCRRRSPASTNRIAGSTVLIGTRVARAAHGTPVQVVPRTAKCDLAHANHTPKKTGRIFNVDSRSFVPKCEHHCLPPVIIDKDNFILVCSTPPFPNPERIIGALVRNPSRRPFVDVVFVSYKRVGVILESYVRLHECTWGITSTN